MKKQWPLYSAKSTSSCSHGCLATGHSCRGADDDSVALTSMHCPHDFTTASTSSSNVGHHTKLLARLFILTIHVCSLCSLSRTRFWRVGGMMAHSPHRDLAQSIVHVAYYNRVSCHLLHMKAIHSEFSKAPWTKQDLSLWLQLCLWLLLVAYWLRKVEHWGFLKKFKGNLQSQMVTYYRHIVPCVC